MANRKRRSSRERRVSSGSPRAATHDRPVTPTTRRSYSGSQRPGSSVRPGVSRAIGEPSPVLEREAIQERSFVTKDFKRIGIVVAVMVALLLVSDVAVNALLP